MRSERKERERKQIVMITVDISGIWGDLSLPELLSAEKEVFDAHMLLTEKNGPGCDFLGWVDLPVEEE